jgi:hypothetical protein
MRILAWLFAIVAAAFAASAALALIGVNLSWTVGLGIVLIALFGDAGAIGWPSAILGAIFFGALAFGFAGLRSKANG